MSDIAPVSSSSLIGALSANESRARKAEQIESTNVALSREADAVEISPLARFVAMARENPIREDLVESIRQQIAEGTYDTDDKLDKALDEMFRDHR
jgi:negative regulator of flagellin synthesis FlgM